MSYARFSESSDVYVYRSNNVITYYEKDAEHQIFVCCSCRLTLKTTTTMFGRFKWYGEYVFESREEMIDHLLIHQEAGHKVPQHTFDRLIDEIIRH